MLDGAIVMTDGEGNAKSKLVFSGAFITDVTFPALDAASDAAAFLEMTLAPDETEMLPASGKLALTPQKAWLASNFRLQIPGVDATKVSRIGAFTVHQPVAEGHPAGSLQVPALSVSFSLSSQASWNTWAGMFLPGGSAGDQGEKTGKIVYLDTSLTQTLSSVNLTGLGVVTLTQPGYVAGSQTIPKIEATLYCEEMGFVHP
jgi:hypothetical protein